MVLDAFVISEIRCTKCNKLLGYIEGKYQVKCPRCGEMNIKDGMIEVGSVKLSCVREE